MDGPVPAPKTDRVAIEDAARNMGIVPGDPAYAFVQFMLQRQDDHAAEHQVHEERLAKLLDRAETVAGGQLARTATLELPRAVDRLVAQRFSVMAVAAAVTMIAMVALGFGAGWWIYHLPDLQCLDQAGGRVCFVWTSPPVKEAGG
jgi:hypothetical protein